MSRTVHVDGRRKRWLAVLLSVLVHSTIVAAIGWSWFQLRAPVRAPQQLAIEATVVVEKSARAAPAAAPAEPAAQAAPPEPAPEPTPKPEVKKADEQAARDKEREAAAEAAAKIKEQQEAEQQAAHEKEATERAAQEQAQAAKEKSKRESELRAQLAAEERINAARGSADEVAWLALIRDRVTRAWIRPPSARAGVNCEVRVTQVPGGVVTGVQIGSCNGDSAVRESIEAAVYRASPLPTPTNPDLFDRNLKFNFHPDE